MSTLAHSVPRPAAVMALTWRDLQIYLSYRLMMTLDLWIGGPGRRRLLLHLRDLRGNDERRPRRCPRPTSRSRSWASQSRW
jgi:hypothetical protein